MCVSFLYTKVSYVLLGPVETEVSKNETDPLLLGTSEVNYRSGKMELMWCRNCCAVCSVFATNIVLVLLPVFF